MSTRRKTVLALGAIGAGCAGPTEALAVTLEQRLEAMERKMSQMESKLERAETENQKLRSQLAKAVPVGVAGNSEVKAMADKVAVLERRLDLDKAAAAEVAKKAPKLEAGPDGVRFSSADGDHVVRLRGAVQTDAKMFMNDTSQIAPANATGTRGNNIPDRLELKQARVWLEGTLWKSLDFKVMQEFGGNTASSLFDAYIDAKYFPYASLSVGKQKTPLALERLQGDSDGSFLERAFPTYLASNREVGVMLHGAFGRPGYNPAPGSGPVDFKNFLSYQLGVFNGNGDNTSPANATTDSKDDKEFIGRLFAHPFKLFGIQVLDGLGIGLAGSWEQPLNRAAPASLVSPIGQNTILNYANLGVKSAATGAAGTATGSILANGDHYRLYPQAYWYYGPFGLLGEYVVSSQNLLGSNGLTGTKLAKHSIQQDNTAWQIQASYVLTGEDNTFQSVKPQAPFDPATGNWGAFQLVGRITGLNVDKDSFANLGTAARPFALLDPTKSIQAANSFAVGVNWFLNKNVRVMTDFERTSFTGGAGSGAGTAASPYRVSDRPSENVWGTRFQLVF